MKTNRRPTLGALIPVVLDGVGALLLLNFAHNSKGFVLQSSTKERAFYLVSTLSDGPDTHNMLTVLAVFYGAYLFHRVVAVFGYSLLADCIAEAILLAVFALVAYIFAVYAGCSAFLTIYFGNYSLLAFLAVFGVMRAARVYALATGMLALGRNTQTDDFA